MPWRLNANFLGDIWSWRIIHLMPLVSFYSPWIHQKTRGFLTFSGVQKKTSGMKYVKTVWIPSRSCISCQNLSDQSHLHSIWQQLLCTTFKVFFYQFFFLTIETLEQALKICSKLTLKTPERRHWRRSGVFIFNFEHISDLFLGFYW